MKLYYTSPVAVHRNVSKSNTTHFAIFIIRRFLRSLFLQISIPTSYRAKSMKKRGGGGREKNPWILVYTLSK